MRVILASASPRRSDLLNQVGIKFEVQVSDVQEKIIGNIPSDIVKNLAMQKAEDIFNKNIGDVLVIGADTVVAKDNEIMGKPVDEKDAFDKIKMLQGDEHKVYTGVCVCYRLNGKENNISFYEESSVYMHKMSDEQILDYIETKEPMDKAGAYGIQGICAIYIEKINGDYNNIVGLPVSRLYQECLKIGIDLRNI